jgi:glycosyltransferase involved in cell wall biosynthesis
MIETEINTLENINIPQLIITGHGSIDDPEGHVIHKEIIDRIESMMDKYDLYIRDIFIVRLGPSDQMLNALLSGAMVAFQLSLREGFEVKVSEALLKGIPVVAYASGGIPLQIRNNIDGHLIQTGDTIQVAEKMKMLTINTQHYEKLKNHAAEDNREWILTPSNILQWNYIMLNGNAVDQEELLPNRPRSS